MARMLGYMVTWTTYGSWLQGDRRGYVKDGKILGENEVVRKANVRKLKTDPVELGDQEREMLRDSILKKE